MGDGVSAEERGSRSEDGGKIMPERVVALIAAAAVGGFGMFRIWDVSHYLFWAPEVFAKSFHELGNLWVHGMVLGTASLLAGLCLVLVSLAVIVRIFRSEEPCDLDEECSDGKANRESALLERQAMLEARIAELEKPLCDSEQGVRKL